MSFRLRSLSEIMSGISEYYSPPSCLQAYRVCITSQWVRISQWCLYFLKPVISVLYIYTDHLLHRPCRRMQSTAINHPEVTALALSHHLQKHLEKKV